MRPQDLALALSLVIGVPLGHTAHKIGVRRFLKNCFLALSEPVQIAKSIDLRNDFSSELDRILQSESSVKVLDLGSYDYHPWTLLVADALQKENSVASPTNSIHPYVLQKGEITPLPSSGPHSKPKNKEFNLIYDAGLGPASRLTGLSKSLHYASDNLAPGGILAIAFPYAKNPLSSTPREFSQKIAATLLGDKQLLHVQRRYNFLSAYPPSTQGPDFIRLDGIYVRKKDGSFETLLTWIEKSMPDFEIVPAPLDLGSNALEFLDPLIHTSNMLHFNQLVLRKKPKDPEAAQQAPAEAPSRPRLRYVGTIGSEDAQSMATLPFHFFDEF